ncbi:uncharacterized protein LOC113360544 [Papaver somniferum]|uniref:uncharacterized protein LOC113360544 n=1 Tax=Papaver somniferum TaxID=3469 RepID=UPI000E7018FF|nr:uncharacterized protein LOC113360544 [Papaver somniferum]
MINESKSKNYCLYHEAHGHHINDRKNLIRFINDLVKEGNLKEFISKGRNPISTKEVKGCVKMINFVDRIRNDSHPDLIKRKRNLYKINVTCIHPSFKGFLLPQDEIRFTSRDLARVRFSHSDALVVGMIFYGWDCRKILIDQGSTCNIIYMQPAEKMKLTEGDLRANNAIIVGFDGSRTRGFSSSQHPFTLQCDPRKELVTCNASSSFDLSPESEIHDELWRKRDPGKSSSFKRISSIISGSVGRSTWWTKEMEILKGNYQS